MPHCWCYNLCTRSLKQFLLVFILFPSLQITGICGWFLSLATTFVFFSNNPAVGPNHLSAFLLSTSYCIPAISLIMSRCPFCLLPVVLSLLTSFTLKPGEFVMKRGHFVNGILSVCYLPWDGGIFCSLLDDLSIIYMVGFGGMRNLSLSPTGLTLKYHPALYAMQRYKVQTQTS